MHPDGRTIGVLGLGYIGLPTSLLLARAGFKVIGVDKEERVVNRINAGYVPAGEPGLGELLDGASGNFIASMAVPDAEAYFICVPTPLVESTRAADLSYVKRATEMIAPHLSDGNIVVIESTVPPGTSDKLVIPTLLRSGVDREELQVVHCPERAIPGHVLKEMVENDRIVGGNTPTAAQLAKDIYSSFVRGNIHITDLVTAEFVKLMENTFRDVNIALINEFAKIADGYNIDVWEARMLANLHPRVELMKPGPGVGGHCIAIDPWFLAEGSTACRMVPLAREINDTMPNYALSMIREAVGDRREVNLTIMGVAYKGNVGDTRQTPAIKLAMLAENEGYTVRCYDPLVKEFQYPLYDLVEATEQSDCLILMTDHDSFRNIDPRSLNMRSRNLVDTRDSLDHSAWRDAGFKVSILGARRRSAIQSQAPVADQEAKRQQAVIAQAIGGVR